MSAFFNAYLCSCSVWPVGTVLEFFDVIMIGVLPQVLFKTHPLLGDVVWHLLINIIE